MRSTLYRLLCIISVFDANKRTDSICRNRLLVVRCRRLHLWQAPRQKLLGKHKAKFSAKISPNKTIEGYVGGILCTAIAIPICPLLGLEYDPQLIVFLAICGVTAEIGDLLGSATKRQLNIKDSGDGIRNMPIFNVIEYPLRGHGGYLDRLDSISLNLLLFALINVPKY